MAGFHYTETFPETLDTMNGESSRSSLRALEVFEAFREARRPLSLSEVARMTDMPVSTCHGVLGWALEQRGFLRSFGAGRDAT
jgi:DNA-binding IclR family transcriptional regulator